MADLYFEPTATQIFEASINYRRYMHKRQESHKASELRPFRSRRCSCHYKKRPKISTDEIPRFSFSAKDILILEFLLNPSYSLETTSTGTRLAVLV